MFADNTLIIINVTCIVFLVVMLVILAAATRMKGGAGWAAVIVVTTTVPVYLANLTRDIAADNFLFFVYLAYFLNALCFPALWFFTRSQFEKSFRFTVRQLWHTIPAFISLFAHIIYYAPLTTEQVEAERAFLENGNENLPAIINDVIIFGQFFIYFAVIFFYVRKRKKYLQDNFSDTDYIKTLWTTNFLILFFVLFFAVFVAYTINPRTDAWLIPILNSLGMAYLVYVVMYHSTAAYLNRLPDIAPSNSPKGGKSSPPSEGLGEAAMKEICDRVTEYLQTSKAYTNPDLSLSILSVATGISPRTISTSINGYLKRNFFDLINQMRVEEAKIRLRTHRDIQTIESIGADCGFRSPTPFYEAFKKSEGKTPLQWLKTVNKG